MLHTLHAICGQEIREVEAFDRTHVIKGAFYVPSLDQTLTMGHHIFPTRKEAAVALIEQLKKEIVDKEKVIKSLEEEIG